MEPTSVSANQDSDETESRPVVLLIEEVSLPMDGVERMEAVDELSEVVREALALADACDDSPDRVIGRAGYQYAAIPNECPSCESRVRFSRTVTDTANGIYAFATCTDGDCGWTGSGIYRLIDMRSADDTEGSIVEQGIVSPVFHPY